MVTLQLVNKKFKQANVMLMADADVTLMQMADQAQNHKTNQALCYCMQGVVFSQKKKKYARCCERGGTNNSTIISSVSTKHGLISIHRDK